MTTQTRKLSSLERQEQLLGLIKTSSRITVEEICARFQVSEATARRDLDTLAKAGAIRRIHGGALSTVDAPLELPIINRLDDQSAAKDRIGKAAAELVRDGETIFLGSGTTTLSVAHYLVARQNLTVITNSLLIANFLVDYANINLVILGGMLRRSELSMIGHITEQSVNELRADKVIIGIHSIDPELGLTNQYLQETLTDRSILKLAREVIIVADHTKFGRVSTGLVAPVTVMNKLITDTETPPEFIELLREKNINVLQV